MLSPAIPVCSDWVKSLTPAFFYSLDSTGYETTHFEWFCVFCDLQLEFFGCRERLIFSCFSCIFTIACLLILRWWHYKFLVAMHVALISTRAHDCQILHRLDKLLILILLAFLMYITQVQFHQIANVFFICLRHHKRKGSINILTCFAWCFEEFEAILTCETLYRRQFNLSLSFKVALICK